MNRLYYGDNLEVLRDTAAFPDASVDLIYLDPPFYSNAVNAKTLRPLIVTNIDRVSHLMTDESMVYTRVGHEFAGHTSVSASE